MIPPTLFVSDFNCKSKVSKFEENEKKWIKNCEKKEKIFTIMMF